MTTHLLGSRSVVWREGGKCTDRGGLQLQGLLK